jgi:nucleoside-diphosphate-sugar epimerase
MADFNGRQVLVTGATGFIGARLARRLVESGARVRVYVRDVARLEPELRARCEVAVGDLSDRAVMRRAVEGESVIFHCAANVHTWDTWEAYRRTNVEGVENLLDAIEASAAAPDRLVHISTVDVYGFPVQPCNEDSTADGGGFGYGRSKWQGEVVLRRRCEASDIPYTVIRPCNVIGPGSQFVARIGHELRSGLMLKVDGGRVNAGLVYIDNLVDWLLWTATSPAAINQCYNVRDAYDASWSDFIDRLKRDIAGRGLVLSLPFELADLAARGCELVYGLLLPGREPLLHRLLVRLFGRTCGHYADKIRRHSGFSGQVEFEEAMTRSANWFKEYNKT